MSHFATSRSLRHHYGLDWRSQFVTSNQYLAVFSVELDVTICDNLFGLVTVCDRFRFMFFYYLFLLGHCINFSAKLRNLLENITIYYKFIHYLIEKCKQAMRFCPLGSVACYQRDARTISGKSTTKSGMVSTFSVRRGNHFSMAKLTCTGCICPTV